MKIIKVTPVFLAFLATLFVASQNLALLPYTLIFLPSTLVFLISLNKAALALSGRAVNKSVSVFWIVMMTAAGCAFVLAGLTLPDVPHLWIYALKEKVTTSLFASCSIALFILLCLRSETDFPKWTQLLSASLLITLYLSLSPFHLHWHIISHDDSSSSYSISAFPLYKSTYRAIIDFKNDYTATLSEDYEIVPYSAFFTVGIKNVDQAWSVKEQNFSLTSLKRFKIPSQPDWKSEPGEGVFLTARRTLRARKTSIGLLRKKLDLVPWRMKVSDGKNSIYLGSVSRISGELRLRMPKNSFLASTPSGNFVSLPDRDELVITFVDRQPEITIYYLNTFRISIVRAVLSSSSDSDIFLRILAYLLWPIVLLLYGTLQSEASQKILEKLKRKPKRRSAGF